MSADKRIPSTGPHASRDAIVPPSWPASSGCLDIASGALPLLQQEQTGDAGTDELSSLLTLPEHLQLCILRLLNVAALCAAAQTCAHLLSLASKAELWPDALQHEDCVTIAARLCLASVLHLPPQVFHLSMEVKRSRRFPLSATLQNLRSFLGVVDVEGLAERTSRALQEKASRQCKHLPFHGDAWKCWPPTAAISFCRSDRASVRLGVRPAAVVPRLLSDLQGLGWPSPSTPGTPAAAGPPSTLCRSDTEDGQQQQQQQQQQQEQQQEQQQARVGAVMQELQATQQAFAAGIAQAAWVQRPRQAREPKERLASLATWASNALPHPTTARAHALQYFGARDAAEQSHLAVSAVRLMFGGAWDGTVVVNGKPGWLRLLEKCCLVVLRRQRLEELCVAISERLCPAAAGAGSAPVSRVAHMATEAALQSAFDAPWRTASAADALVLLQLAGLKAAVARAADASHAELCAFAQATDGALADWQQQSACMGAFSTVLVLGMPVDEASQQSEEARHIGDVLEHCMQRKPAVCSHDTTQQLDDHSSHALVRLRIHVEGLRVLHWCMFMLGADNDRYETQGSAAGVAAETSRT